MPAEGETPVDAYVAAAAAPGTIDYFVLLFAEPSQRAVLAAGIALGKVVMNVARQDTETDIRYLKLQWWREEVGRARDANARHPLTAALTSRLDHTAWLVPLDRLIAGAHNEIGITRFDTLKRLLPHCHYAAQRQALLVSLDRHCDDAALASARAAGVGICLTEMLRNRDSRLPDTGFDDGASDTGTQLAAIAEDHFAAMQPGTATSAAGMTVQLQAALYRQTLQRTAKGLHTHTLALLWQAWRHAVKLRG